MFSEAVLVAAPALLPFASVSSEKVVPATATAASPAPAIPPRNLRRCSPLPLRCSPLGRLAVPLVGSMLFVMSRDA